MRLTTKAAAAIGITGAAAAVWGIGIERYLFTLREYELPVLPAGAKPIRILHISDTHMAPWQHRKADWLASLAELKPDVIINTGDNMGHPEGLRGLRRAYGAFAGIPGAFVNGSNDFYAPKPRNPLRYFKGPSKAPGEKEIPLDIRAMTDYFSNELGWDDIDNDSTSLVANGQRLDLIGVGDAHVDWDRLDLIEQSRATLPKGEPVATLGVTHAPYQRVLNALSDTDAMLAGHTHGGQVCIPGYGALVSNCDLPTRQAKGMTEWNGTPLHVCAGTGHNIYTPVRFACRPEASLITAIPKV